MPIDITITIGGEAGQGVQTLGRMLCRCCRMGNLQVFAINDFESRIRGGHSFCQVRIADHHVAAPSHSISVIVAMDARTVTAHAPHLRTDGIIISNPADAIDDRRCHPLEITKLAADAGGARYANTVAVGATLQLLGAPLTFINQTIDAFFPDPAQQQANRAAASAGFAAAHALPRTCTLLWPDTPHDGLLLDGTQCLSLGALAGDCRLAAFYPMSPATGIMLNLAQWQQQVPVLVEQVEDEIAAVSMITGAAYAGVRALTATSGGGFCLMAEGLGYAGIAELPIVIIDAQRPGPATGMATRTAQGDLQMVLHAGQDDFPRFVFAPGSPQEAYATTARAFALAEQFQTPAIILTDQYFNDSLYSLDQALPVPDTVPRSLHRTDDPTYQRYRLTADGVSPRAIPCSGAALVAISGNEHGEDGHMTEDPDTRSAMVNKRARKLEAMREQLQLPECRFADAPIKLVGWGSTRGVIAEAVDHLRTTGLDVGQVHFCDLWPLPATGVLDLLGGTPALYTIEQNSTGQLAQLLRQETGLKVTDTLLKYDGRPWYPHHIIQTMLSAVR